MRRLVPIALEPTALAWLADRCDLPGIIERLNNGKAGGYAVKGTDTAIVLSTGLAIDTGERALWVESLGGKSLAGPKANRAVLVDVLADCEDIGRSSNCVAIRIEASTRQSLKLKMFARFGFEALRNNTSTTMRKALPNG